MTASGDTLALVALVTSILSAAVAALALGWTIYRDVFSKPRAKVFAGRSIVTGPELRDYIGVSVTNFGPGAIHIQVVQIRFRSRRVLLGIRTPWDQAGVVMDVGANRLSTALPARLDVGEKAHFLYPWASDSFASYYLTALGVTDSFGRKHWVPGRELAQMRAAFRAEFPDAKPTTAPGAPPDAN